MRCAATKTADLFLLNARRRRRAARFVEMLLVGVQNFATPAHERPAAGVRSVDEHIGEFCLLTTHSAVIPLIRGRTTGLNDRESYNEFTCTYKGWAFAWSVTGAPLKVRLIN